MSAFPSRARWSSRISPSGAIREGVFMPPLSPTLMSCADKAIGARPFSAGRSVAADQGAGATLARRADAFRPLR